MSSSTPELIVDYRYIEAWQTNNTATDIYNPHSGAKLVLGSPTYKKCLAEYEKYLAASKVSTCPNPGCGKKKVIAAPCNSCKSSQSEYKKPPTKRTVTIAADQTVEKKPILRKNEKPITGDSATEPATEKKPAPRKTEKSTTGESVTEPATEKKPAPRKTEKVPEKTTDTKKVNYALIRAWRLNDEVNPITKRAIVKHGALWKEIDASVKAEEAKVASWKSCPNCGRAARGSDGLCMVC